jgi:hypothetical protein
MIHQDVPHHLRGDRHIPNAWKSSASDRRSQFARDGRIRNIPSAPA